MRFDERLKLLREKTGYNQKEAAEKLGLVYNTYNHYESGRREPDIDTLKMMANYFDVTLDYLMGKVDHPQTIIRYDVPEELRKLGVEYLVIAKYLQDKAIPPETVKQLIETIQTIKAKV